jgi:hypothetical protein
MTPEMQAVSPQNPRLTYDYSAAMFSHAANAIRLSKGSLAIELVLGDAFAVMDDVRTCCLGLQLYSPLLLRRFVTERWSASRDFPRGSLGYTCQTFQITCAYQ